MVRKWSYLEVNKFILKKINFFLIKKNLKIFKVTTKFKKFQLGYTKILRKKYILRKRKTNYINLFFILFIWVKYTLKIKNFFKIFQILGFFNLTTCLTSFNNLFIQKKIKINLKYNIIRFQNSLFTIFQPNKLNKQLNTFSSLLFNSIDTGINNMNNGLIFYDKNYFLNNLKVNKKKCYLLIYLKIINYTLIFYKIYIILLLKNIKININYGSKKFLY